VPINIRPAAVAGSWYPASPDALGRQVDAYVARAQIAEASAPKAIVAPHAGLKYSGPVAAFAYKSCLAAAEGEGEGGAASRAPYSAAVLIGPSHFVGFDGVSIWPSGAWETPLGPVKVADELAERIRAASAAITEERHAHGREHSLEMQLPFIARLLPGVPIVPMVMGYQSRQTAFGLGETLALALRNRALAGADVLLVASSDLSHYEDAHTAARLDGVVLQHVAELDAEGLMRALEMQPQHACGGGPMVAVLHAARLLGATRARVLKYGDSGDVSGDKSSVVGYMAAAVW